MNKSVVAVAVAVFAASALVSGSTMAAKLPPSPTSLSSKPKGPLKVIRVQKFENGKLVYDKKCTGRGQKYCAGN